MDRIGGWNVGRRNEEGSLTRARFAASMWIYTEAVICSGQKNMEAFRRHKKNSIMEAVNWVCAYFLDDHDWISDQ